MFRRSKPSDNATRQPTSNVTPRNKQGVFSYRAARQVREGDADRQLESLQERQRVTQVGARRRAKVIASIVVLIALFIYVSWLSGVPRVVVVGKDADRTLLQNITVYQQAATRLLAASPANHDKLTIDASTIATKLEEAYPELASVSIQSPLFGHQPQVAIVPALPVLRLVTTAGSTFLIGASGKALAPVSASTPSSELATPLVTDQSGLAIQTGSAALPTTDVIFIQTVIAQLQVQHIVSTTLTLPQGTSELDVGLSAKPYFVKFNLESAADQQIGTFLAVNKYLAAHSVTPAHYIDVRVPGRAYYL